MGITDTYKRQSKAIRITVWVVGAIVVLAIIGSLLPSNKADNAVAHPAATTTTQAPKTTATKAPVKEPFDSTAYAKSIEAKYVELNGRPIKDSCDAAFTNWQCFYDGIDAKSQSRIDIKLSTPGDVTKDQAKKMSERARLAYFNFVGADFKKLDTIVTYVNGRDTGTTRRSNVPLLNQ